jgi:WXG100 family type VII secretion target
MPTLRIDVEKVEDLARQIKSEREGSVETLLGKLRSINNDLDAAWDGPAQSTFQGTYGNWIDQLQQYSQTLNSINGYLLSVADNFRRIDEEARSSAAQAAAKA